MIYAPYVPQSVPQSVQTQSYPQSYPLVYATIQVPPSYTSEVLYPPVYHPPSMSYLYPSSIPGTSSAPSIVGSVTAGNGHIMDTQSLLNNPQVNIASIAPVV